jgi:hypothetical protein
VLEVTNYTGIARHRVPIETARVSQLTVRMTNTRGLVLAAALGTAVVSAPRAALCSETGERAGGVVEESAKTGGHAVRDGFLTFGRTVRDFFTGGPDEARETWRENAEETKENAREGADRVEDAAD